MFGLRLKPCVIGMLLMAFAWKAVAATVMIGCHMSMSMGGTHHMGNAAPVVVAHGNGDAPQAHANAPLASDPQGQCSQCAPCCLTPLLGASPSTPAAVQPQSPEVAAQGCADLSTVASRLDRPPKRSA